MTEQVITAKRIKLLTADVASKIAAGEVVERPASVLKELLENSLDAGANKIDVAIAGGGIQSIIVTDNGSGILREDLTLALQQHATSKITSAHDLATISSLGFRGEALASINSVAKFSITSQTADQEHAWCVDASGINPAAHPLGTTVKMQDLFYNLPARRKFLRSERTEYLYLEEVFRRIALSNFNVAFTLSNNGKLVKNLPSCKDQTARTRRLINLCGKQVLNNATTIDAEQNGMALWGWLGAAQDARSQEAHQYFFINQRVIKDRLINHAIRQVYQPLCAEGKMPFYCLYLELDPVALDVNVHPTKHEVRFRDARIIHAFITQTLNAAFGSSTNLLNNVTHTGYFNNTFKSYANVQIIEGKLQVLSIIANRWIIAQHKDSMLIIDAHAMQKELLVQSLQQKQNQLFNTTQSINLNHEKLASEDFLLWCNRLGFVLERFGQQNLLLRSLPIALQGLKLNWAALLLALYDAWQNSIELPSCYAIIAANIEIAIKYTLETAQELLLHLGVVAKNGVWCELSCDQMQALIT